MTLRGFSSELKDSPSWRHAPHPYGRDYHHAELTYRGRPIGVPSTSPVKNAEVGQRVRVHVSMDGSGTNRYLVVEEPIPAGMQFVKGSLDAQNVSHYELRAGAAGPQAV